MVAPHKTKIWKNENVQTAIIVGLILLLVFGFWFGFQLVLNTSIPPALAVVSGSMCIPRGGACDDWTSVSHPFDRTLHKGDIIIIQGVEPSALNGNYPDSDIIVFHRPDNPSELIVHRIVKTETINGKLYFYTKGDGNPPTDWPSPVNNQYDYWNNGNTGIPSGAVSEDLVEGKVIMRIPWIGWIALFMQWLQERLNIQGTNIGIYLIAIIIILIVVIEIVFPILRRYRKKQNNLENLGKDKQTTAT